MMRATLPLSSRSRGLLLGLMAVLALALVAAPARADILSSFTASSSSTQAGAHADSTTSFLVAPGDDGSYPERASTLRFHLPPGLLGNVGSFPTCPLADVRSSCPADTQIGEGTVPLVFAPGFTFDAPAQVFNVTPAGDDVATLAINALSGVSIVYMHLTVRPSDYGLDATINDLPKLVGGTTLTLWGVPFDHTGAGQRKPFMTNPAVCGQSAVTTLQVDSYQHPGQFETYSATTPAQTGCDAESFQPSIWTQADAPFVNSPSSFTFGVTIPQNDDPDGVATPPLRKIVAVLPDGMTINPSVANGLNACSDAQFGQGSSAPSTCPSESRIGTVGFQVPSLPDPQVAGTIYLGAPKPGDPFRVFLEAYGSNVRVKLTGDIVPDPKTGRLSAVFDDNPQVPVSAIKLAFRGGPLAPLAMPPSCGVKPVVAGIDSWAGGPSASAGSQLNVRYDAAGDPCPAKLGFHPAFTAGTDNPAGGADTGFQLVFGRDDVDQDLGSIRLSLPVGLLGRLTAATLCPADRAAAGTCGDESLVGDARVWAGAGSSPLQVQGGRVYLTQPYRDGDVAGLAIVVHALAGPYDLGTPVVRAGIRVRPDTGLDVEAEPLPTILQGVPLRIRRVNVNLGLPGFMMNPTDCSPKRITGTITSAAGDTSDVSAPFQATGCSKLPFAPGMRLATIAPAKSGATTGLSVHLTQQKGESHLARVQLTLPRQLGARLDGPIKTPCTTEQFQSSACPAASRVGSASATTPVLPGKLTSPVWFVENASGRGGLPRLGIRLTSGPVAVDLLGDVTLNRAGRIVTVFDGIPDVPIDAFDLSLARGASAPLTASGICGRRLTANAVLSSHSGHRLTRTVSIAVGGCGGASRAHPRSA